MRDAIRRNQMQSPGGASGVSVSVCGALGRNISKVAAGGAVLSGSSCTAKLWNAERERERERRAHPIKSHQGSIKSNHAQSCAIKSHPEPSRAIQSHPEPSRAIQSNQSNHLWKASRGIEAADGSGDQRLPITAPSARSSELGGDFGARRSVTRACISSRRAISRAAILCACTCRGNEGGNQHAIRRAAILCAITVRGSTIATKCSAAPSPIPAISRQLPSRAQRSKLGLSTSRRACSRRESACTFEGDSGFHTRSSRTRT